MPTVVSIHTNIFHLKNEIIFSNSHQHLNNGETMNPYKIYKHPSGDIEAVKQGWSWPGFFFSYIWVMIKQLWKILGIMTLALVIFAVFICVFGLRDAGDVLTDAFSLILHVTCGTFGNFWREDKLISRGYKLVHIVTAYSAEDALNFHYDSVA